MAEKKWISLIFFHPYKWRYSWKGPTLQNFCWFFQKNSKDFNHLLQKVLKIKTSRRKFFMAGLQLPIPTDEPLVFQTPCEDRCLDPETPPEVQPLGGPFTPPNRRYDWRILEDFDRRISLLANEKPGNESLPSWENLQGWGDPNSPFWRGDDSQGLTRDLRKW